MYLALSRNSNKSWTEISESYCHENREWKLPFLLWFCYVSWSSSDGWLFLFVFFFSWALMSIWTPRETITCTVEKESERERERERDRQTDRLRQWQRHREELVQGEARETIIFTDERECKGKPLGSYSPCKSHSPSLSYYNYLIRYTSCYWDW